MSNSQLMRRFFVFALFVSLLMQLAMPAMAMPAPQAMSQMEHSAHDDSEHHAKAGHEQKPQAPHCPLAALGCNMAMCIVCTALSPTVPVAVTPSLLGGAPAPDPVQPMAQSEPRPLLPPPRA